MIQERKFTKRFVKPKNEKPTRGTIACYGRKVDAREVITHYATDSWGNIPKSFGEGRAIELHASCGWAISYIRHLELEIRRMKKKAKAL